MAERYLRLFAVLIYVLDDVSGDAAKPISSREYLGSPATKAYHFPWIVSIHRESAYDAELFGTGSILSNYWVFGSMDSFVRNSRAGNPFFQDIERVVLYSSGVWGTPYLKDNERGPNWLEKRRAVAVYMFSDPDRSKAKKIMFDEDHQPSDVNNFKRSPFGFSMSIALIKTDKERKGFSNIDYWFWNRITLPMPLFASKASDLEVRVEEEMEILEKAPSSIQCFVGGWRPGDYRLVQHKVAYVPLDLCQSVYCSFDNRACNVWPVKGVHACFDSVSFTHPCWADAGSALYCDPINKSVIAILTSAPTCGVYGLPAVFTLIHYGLALYEAVNGPNDPYQYPLKEEDLERYKPPPQDALIPVY